MSQGNLFDGPGNDEVTLNRLARVEERTAAHDVEIQQLKASDKLLAETDAKILAELTTIRERIPSNTQTHSVVGAILLMAVLALLKYLGIDVPEGVFR